MGHISVSSGLHLPLKPLPLGQDEQASCNSFSSKEKKDLNGGHGGAGLKKKKGALLEVMEGMEESKKVRKKDMRNRLRQKTKKMCKLVRKRVKGNKIQL